LFKYLHS